MTDTQRPDFVREIIELANSNRSSYGSVVLLALAGAMQMGREEELSDIIMPWVEEQKRRISTKLAESAGTNQGTTKE